jgi:hypothetical protein
MSDEVMGDKNKRFSYHPSLFAVTEEKLCQ